MNPWLAAPGVVAPRRLIAESWDRARGRRLDPERASAPLSLDPAALEHHRGTHPLASALPVIRRLLVRDADEDSGVVVAVGDAAGRLLWIEGDAGLQRRAEGMRFMAGADWSEAVVGTSAPGTALALDHGIQIAGAEHFAEPVRDWSCTAVPVHDLETHEIIGVIDITGGSAVVAPHTLPLLEATAAAVERELLVQRLRAPRRRRRATPERVRAAQLAVLGRDRGVLTVGGVPTELSVRHAELLTLLASHRAGLTAERLAELVYGRADAVVTLRAEMVRLRHVLERAAPRLVPLARPYRLPVPVDLDLGIVIGLLDRGAHRAALAAYVGEVLPASVAPGVEELRAEIAGRVRESVLEGAGAEVLLRYAASAAGTADGEVWRTLLQVLPARSPRRAAVVAHLQALERRVPER